MFAFICELDIVATVVQEYYVDAGCRRYASRVGLIGWRCPKQVSGKLALMQTCFVVAAPCQSCRQGCRVARDDLIEQLAESRMAIAVGVLVGLEIR